MSFVQLGDLVKQFVSLIRSKTNTSDVVEALSMFIEVIVTEVRLDGERPKQRVRHKRTWKPIHKHGHSVSISQWF